MSQICAIKDCKRASRTLCHCCNQNLCRDHFNEHDDLLNSQLNPLTDEINALADRLAAINLDKITKNSHQKLNQWRIDCHETIDRFYEQKCQELDRYVTENIDKQRKEIADLRSKMNKLIDKQEATKNDINSLTLAIRNLEQKMNEIEQIRIQVDICPLTIDDRVVQIGKPKVHRFDLLTLPSAYQTIKYSRNISHALASNNEFLLMHIDLYLCLFNRDLSMVKQKKWEYTNIEDMCWSSAMNGFFIITKNDVFLVDEHMTLVGRIQQIEAEMWWACGCSDKSLYLSRAAWDSSILEFSLLPSIRFVKVWKTTDKLQQKQRLDAIVYNHGTLAMVINDQSSEAKLIELRSLETLSPLWSIQLDVNYSSGAVRCCLLNHNEWLLADWTTSRLFHITNDGKLKGTCKYTSIPYYTHLFGSDILAILAEESVNFHKL